MTNFEKQNIRNLVVEIREGLRTHELFCQKYDGEYPCGVTSYIPYEDEDVVAYVYVHSYKTGKSKYLTEHELLLFVNWLDNLNYVQGTIWTIEQAYDNAKSDIVRRVAAWVS